ncbi:MAG: hypothetical protein ACLFR2_10215 [Candidatus Kapaibacterium sp.]
MLLPCILIARNTQDTIDYNYDKLKGETGAEKVRFLLSDAYQALETNPGKTIRLAENAVDVAIKVSYRMGRGDARLLLGLAHLRLSEYEKATDNLIKAVENYEEKKFKPGLAASYVAIGDLFHSLNNHYYSGESYAAALEIIDQIPEESRNERVYSIRTEALYKITITLKELNKNDEYQMMLDNIRSLENLRGEYTQGINMLTDDKKALPENLQNLPIRIISDRIDQLTARFSGRSENEINELNTKIESILSGRDSISRAQIYYEAAEKIRDDIPVVSIDYYKKATELSKNNILTARALDNYLELAALIDDEEMIARGIEFLKMNYKQLSVDYYDYLSSLNNYAVKEFSNIELKRKEKQISDLTLSKRAMYLYGGVIVAVLIAVTAFLVVRVNKLSSHIKEIPVYRKKELN